MAGYTIKTPVTEMLGITKPIMLAGMNVAAGKLRPCALRPPPRLTCPSPSMQPREACAP